MDQLQALRVFVRIAESGGFSKAADALNVPRATVSKLIQELETHLRVRLFQRSTRRVVVTEEGQVYYHNAVKLLADIDEMDGLFADSHGNPRGRIRVDIGSSLANLILLPHLPAFRKRYPEIQLDVGVSDRQVDLIGEGVDCVIRGGELTDMSLVARRLAGLEWGTYAGSSYLAERGSPSHPDDLLARHEVVGYFSSLSGRVFPLLFEQGDETITVDPKGARGVFVNESTAHLTSLVSGLGVGQTFSFMAQPWLKNGDLVQVLPHWKRPLHPMHIVFPQSKYNSARLKVFVDWVIEVFRPYDSTPAPSHAYALRASGS
ncbi:LysR family transcriptional regulator [Paraburkholderia fungorum]|jgi:LysR family transcriptional regulator for bpeEF and oprC|uniref:LysR substrate-binding domain-containing protein n=1 Tax=Paraburkholderia fungorum TaxID=134537 RepID=UPI000DB4E340|nr:LysR family transcriptional regulator [Paraburkholderia fungorum]PZR49796.1 MAG: LysR family transcriptional regulator [Paraburkholderia fungorum]QLD51947.1 LysR family transcriptional regulator [Paraburkholderia fungorum]